MKKKILVLCSIALLGYLSVSVLTLSPSVTETLPDGLSLKNASTFSKNNDYFKSNKSTYSRKLPEHITKIGV